MKFQNLIESLLLELTGDEIYQKYYNKIPYDIFKSIVAADPQSKIENEKVTRIGKYGKLLISMYQRGGLQLEDLEKASEYLGYVYGHNVAIDVKKINELGDLYNLVSQFIVKDKLDLSSILTALKENEDYKFLYNGNDWLIYQPLTEKGSSYLGYNTEWCTAWGEHSTNKKHKERSCLFRKHHNQGPLYIIINKNNNDEKYQFHFESKQYMDRNDKRVNTLDFLNRNGELMMYFFPSFSREVSKDEIQNELKRMDVLSSEDGLILIKKSIGVVNNRIANALLSDDDNTLNELITVDDGEISSVIYKGNLVIETEGLQQDAEDAERALTYYDYEANNGSDWVREDINNMESEYLDEMMLSYFDSFYNANSKELNSGLGVNNFEQFKTEFFSLFRHNENLIEWFEDKVLDISIDDYETENANVSNSIRETIDFVDEREMHINIPKFVIFLVKKGIDEISDTTTSLWDVIDKYLWENDVPTEFEAQYTSLNQPEFKGDGYGIDKYIVEFFENMINNPEETSKCFEHRKQFYDIVKRYFKSGSNYYENDHVTVLLKSMDVNCEDGTVAVKYKNKDTGEVFGAEKGKDRVKIENLVSLMTNYKLFESIYIAPKIIKG